MLNPLLAKLQSFQPKTRSQRIMAIAVFVAILIVALLHTYDNTQHALAARERYFHAEHQAKQREHEREMRPQSATTLPPGRCACSKTSSFSPLHSLMPVACTLARNQELLRDAFAQRSDLLFSDRYYCELAALETRVTTAQEDESDRVDDPASPTTMPLWRKKLPATRCGECETFHECNRRLDLSRVLPSRCVHSEFFDDPAEQLTEKQKKERKKTLPRHLPFGRSWQTQVVQFGAESLTAVIDQVAARAAALNTLIYHENDPRIFTSAASTGSSSTTRIYLHSYSVPDDWVPRRPVAVENRLFGFVPIGPEIKGWPDSSVYEDDGFRWHGIVPDDNINKRKAAPMLLLPTEDGIARSIAERSIFAVVNCRYGFSSSRLIELMALGTIPVIVDLDVCRNRTRDMQRQHGMTLVYRGSDGDAQQRAGLGCLPHMPFGLLHAARRLRCLRGMISNLWKKKFVGRAQKRGTSTNVSILQNGEVDWLQFDQDQVQRLSIEFHRYAVQHLTSSKVAAQFIAMLSADSASGAGATPPAPLRRVLVVPATNDLVETHTLVYGLISLGIHVTLATTDWNRNWRYYQYYTRFPAGSTADEIQKVKTERGAWGRGMGHVYMAHADANMLGECDVSTRVDECSSMIKKDIHFDAVFYTLVMPTDHKPPRNIEGYPLMATLKESRLGKEKKVLIIDGDDEGVGLLRDWMAEFAVLSRREFVKRM